MQTGLDLRLEPSSKDPALFSDDDEEDDASTDSMDSNEELGMSLYETLSNTLSNFDAAIGSDNAWAWNDVELAQKVFAISVRLQNWKASIVWIATQSASMQTETIEDAHVKELLSSMTSARPFLSSLLLSYFDDINARLQNIRDDLSSGTSSKQTQPHRPLLEKLDTAVQCVCVQLAPISLFAESRPLLQEIPIVKSEQKGNAALGMDKEAELRNEAEPIKYQSQYDWSRKKWKRLRYKSASSKWEFSDYYDGPPPKREATKDREAGSTEVTYGSDPNYHSSYDWDLKKWKRLRYNYTTSKWEFSDYYDGPQPGEERRDSHQQKGTTYSVTPTTGYSQAHIAHAGPSNYAQQPNPYASSTPAHAQAAYQQAAYPRAAYAQPVGSSSEGRLIQGSYNPQNPATALHYKTLDSTYYVRNRSFFQEGRLFSVLFTEPAGANAIRNNAVTDYNSALSYVMLGGVAHTQVRRFIVVRNRKAFCYAVPIFTYHGQGTLKSGVDPQEHAIAYSHGMTPQLIRGEKPLVKAPICIVMNEGVGSLPPASRIRFGIHHPIQYNVKVKDLGYVHPNEVPRFLGYWTMENNFGAQHAQEFIMDTDYDRSGASNTSFGSEGISIGDFLQTV
ncbi:hypothetical protein HBH98_180920 [Parastagonospora nodorum]|nr:hypothetical protein HBH43_048600 [Parastagonospora nodorum]KAH4341147.1 hypothetical protein HBH98_180920 [Parastagonospora nodorum]KAH4378166.1 hypothetical protein HBH99_206080 [Parastagonospora nodorum]KAH4385048.1 hypothetical protein HBH97_073060 [Parastagonospora nodorum]KAH5391544.1 hypothetical protein HBI33_016730 [Parastagonospora nodorum]